MVTLNTAQIQALVQGSISGQVAIGDYIVQIGSVHGGVVNITLPERKPVFRPRVADLRPHPFPGLLDRATETAATLAALQAGEAVEIYAEAGWGKTSILCYTAHQPATHAFSDGVVCLSSVHRRPVGDLLQDLFEALYSCDIPYKPTAVELRSALRGKRMLVLLDDVELQREEVQALLNDTPDSVFLLASSERHLWGTGLALAVRGLPLDDGLALIERELGRSLSAGEYGAAASLCQRLEGHPLRLMQAAALVRDDGRRFHDLVPALPAEQPSAALTAQALAPVAEQDRKLLAALAILPAMTASADELHALAETGDTDARLAALVRRGIVQRDGGRYRLAGTLGDVLRRDWDLAPWRKRALDYFTQWAAAQRATPERMLEQSETLTRLLGWAVGAGLHAEAVRLARALEGALALGRQWERWAQVLQQGLRAAQAAEDRAAEALFQHQLGSHALCLGDSIAARALLSTALEIREALGDRDGASVTRHNLALLEPPPPPVERRKPAPRRGRTALIGGVSAAVLIAVAVLVGILVVVSRNRGGDTGGGSAPAPPPAAASSPATLAFGEVAVGARSAPQRITIANSGGSPLEVQQVTLGGEQAGDFQLTTDCTAGAIDPNGACSISVVFVPSAAGDRSAEVVVADNTPAGEQRIQMSGVGAAPPRPAVSISPTRLDFGSVQIGQPGPEQVVTVTSTGAAALALADVRITGQNAADFALASRCPATLEPSKSCAVGVTFAPRPIAATGSAATASSTARSATLVIGSDAATSAAQVSLSGVAVPPPVPPRASFRPQSLDLAANDRSRTSQGQVTLSNTGGSPLAVNSVTIEGSSAFHIVSDTCSKTTVAPGKSCTVTVSYSFTSATSRPDTASLVFNDNATDTPQRVKLTGTSTVG